MAIKVIYDMTAQAGKGDEFAGVLAELAATVRTLPACEGVDVLRSQDAADQFLFIESWPSDAAYAEAAKQMGEEQEVRARHILVETEDQAKAILADLKKGGDFAAIAKEKSKDTGAAAQGGDLGYFTKDQMVPEFAEVAFKLDKGKLSDPVKSQFGWHIILVEDKRQKPVPEFDKVKDQIESYVQRKAQADLVTKLRAEAKIEKMDAPKPADPAKPADAGKK